MWAHLAVSCTVGKNKKIFLNNMEDGSSCADWAYFLTAVGFERYCRKHHLSHSAPLLLKSFCVSTFQQLSPYIFMHSLTIVLGSFARVGLCIPSPLLFESSLSHPQSWKKDGRGCSCRMTEKLCEWLAGFQMTDT